MIDTLPRLSSPKLAELEAVLRELEKRRDALARLAGVEDEAAAAPVWAEIRAAA